MIDIKIRLRRALRLKLKNFIKLMPLVDVKALVISHGVVLRIALSQSIGILQSEAGSVHETDEALCS